VNEAVHVFARPIPDGWVYPCSAEDIRSRLALVPAEDLRGLWAVGLAPATRKDCWANGRYVPGTRPVITLYSYRQGLSYKQPAGTRRGDLETDLRVERAFGMRTEEIGSRWVCTWSAEDLRAFIVEHVLLHEIGHHVYYVQRGLQGLPPSRNRVEREQFAEAYALRISRGSLGPRIGRLACAR
jgi:hypothetical protein